MFDFFFGSPNKIPENLKPGEISWSELKIGEPIKKGAQSTTYLATYKNQTVVVKKFNLEKEGLGRQTQLFETNSGRIEISSWRTFEPFEKRKWGNLYCAS
jgi:type II restriction/modification system DNA methylase subunit YeeA